MLIGYARVSTVRQDATAQRQRLEFLGVTPERIYVDEGISGKDRRRLGLEKALAACREGDTLIVTKLDRLARSVKVPQKFSPILIRREWRLVSTA